MKNKKMAKLLRLAIIIAAICGAILCASCHWLLLNYYMSKCIESGVYQDIPMNQIYIQDAFYWAVSIPCFIVLGLAWRTTYSIVSNDFFAKQLVKDLKRCVWLLSIDLIVFMIGSVIFKILEWNPFIVFAFLIFGFGISMAILLYVGYEYILRGVEMQEDLEGTV